MNWLEERFPDSLPAATEEFFGELPLALQDRLRSDATVRVPLGHHVADWALGNTSMEIEEGVFATVGDVLARPDSPCRDGGPYAVAQALAKAPLRLWQVERVDPVVELRDALDGTTVTLADADSREFGDVGGLVVARIFEYQGLARHFWLPWWMSEGAVDKVREAQRHHEERRGLVERTGYADEGTFEAFDLARVLADIWLGEQVASLETNEIVDEFEVLDRAAVEAGFVAAGADTQLVDGELHFNFYGDPEGVEDLEEPHQCEDPEHCDAHDFGGVNHLYYGTGVVGDSIFVVTAYPEEADWAKAWIEQNLGGSARYVGRSGPADTETKE